MNLIVGYNNWRDCGIGFQGKIPWISQFRNFWFKHLVQNSVVIMGSKGFESFDKTNLESCIVIVISRDPVFINKHRKNVNIFSDPASALTFAKSLRLPIFINGGKSIYEYYYTNHRLEIDGIYATSIRRNIPFDTTFRLPFHIFESKSSVLNDYTEVKYINLRKQGKEE